MNLLPPSTVRLIASSQVITSVSSVVKELIENSLDAGATSIEVKLDGWGLARIEVRDNGCGIKPEDAPFVAQPHYTSKISSDNDLKSLHTYGFRGEALGSLFSVSNVSVLTKTESEQVGMMYTLDRNGKIEATQPKPTATGTTIIATNLFKNLPVRKQFSSNSKKCKDELKKVEDLVMAYGLVHPSLRISLRHNKAVVWQKNKVSNHRTALLSVFGTALLAQMGVVEFHDENSIDIRVLGYLPKPGSDSEITGRAVNDRCFVFFNGRPVNMKQISQLIKQYYNSHTCGASNRYPVAFLSIQLPPESLDVNLEPNKTSVMLTNKDELITLLTNLLDEFYSDEKNRISESKTGASSNGTEKGIVTSKNGFHVHEEACNGNVPCGQDSSNANTINGESDDVVITHTSNGDIAVFTSDGLNNKSNKHETSPDLDDKILSENTQRKEHCDKAQSSDGCHLNNTAPNNTIDNLLRERRSCQEEANPAMGSQGKDKSPQPDKVGSTDKNKNQHLDQDVHLPSDQQEDANLLAQADSLATDSFNSEEFCETFSDKTLCEISEFDIENNVFTGNSSTHLNEHNSVIENGNLATNNGLSNLYTEDQSKGSNVTGCSEKSQDVLSDGSLTCAPSTSESVEKLFSLDMDDLFEDSNLIASSANSNSEISGTSNNVQIVEKCKSLETPTSASKQGVGSGEKSMLAAAAPSVTNEARCSDKDWSMGRGIVDKQGRPVEPVTLLTPGRSRQLSVGACETTPVIPLYGKRKHSSDQSRLSLSSKKIKKIPEITNQPLITNVMSPNPMQKKLLYKKTEIPFCLNTLKELVKKRAKEQERTVEQDPRSDCLIGRLDPWGVWLLRRGNDIVCVNQYRIQEQLLFQRLMKCHSLPKERISHPIALNERVVGGPECWSTLCSMSTKCDPPGTTRFIDDERLTANGFDICLKTDSESGEAKLELFKMSTSIPFYGVPDLAEVLELIRQNPDSQSNPLSRPFKVIHYLQGEAVRVARSLSTRMNRNDVSDIISRMKKQIPADTQTCVHGRPFFEKITKIPKE